LKAREYIDTPESKVCTLCGEKKLALEFHKNSAVPDGLSNRCKSCAIETAQQHYTANKDAHRECNRRWLASHPGAKKGYSAKYREKHREDLRIAGRKYSKENRKRLEAKLHADPKRLERALNYRKSQTRNRRALKMKAFGKFTAAEFLAICDLHGNRCLRCGGGGKMTVDHVFPLIKGGSNLASNLQPLCLSCNSWKNDKFIDYRPETMDLDDMGMT
jgi:5-methylcytosine-specific restriction endonuclease McrA